MSRELFCILKRSTDPRQMMERVLSNDTLVYTTDTSAFLLKRSLESFRAVADLHLSLLEKIPGGIIAKFVPGLLSRYFMLLKDDKMRHDVRGAVISSIVHVLGRTAGLDEASEEHILNFFRLNGRSEFKEIYIACARSFRTERRAFFLMELVLLDHGLMESEYAVINRNMEEYLRIDVVEKLVDIDKYENSGVVFERIRTMYKDGEDVDRVIHKIQRRFMVEDCVLELCPATDYTVRKMLETDSLERMEKFVGNAVELPLECEVMKKYLSLSSSSGEILGSKLAQRFNVRRIIRDNYDELLEYAFEMVGTNMNAIINLAEIDFRPRLDEFILRSLDLIGRCDAAEEMAKHLYFIKMAVERNCLRRSVLRRVFDGLVYVDHEDYRIRCAKYEILDCLLEQYKRMDDFLRTRAEPNGKDVEASGANTEDIDKDNVFVLVATLWDELNILPVEEELVAFLMVLKRIVHVTSSFYEPRMERSGLVLSLARMLDIKAFSELKRRKVGALVSFIEIAAREFRISKRTFEELFHFLTSYYHILNVGEALDLLIERDRFYGLYLFAQLTKKRRISERLRSFLVGAFEKHASIH
jgi:hypothetical protein